VSARCIFAPAYQYYSAFIADKALMLDDRIIIPSITCSDERDYVPTNKWVVFEHHFAAIAGAGPLISSGKTPKLIKKETQVRMVVGYGAMLT
jgi:carbon starvation protein